MNNRTLTYLTLLVLLGMAVLIGINMKSILTGQPNNQTYLKYNDVRGMAVSHNQLLYTLNFEQQNTVIEILNKAVRVVGVKPGKRQKPTIDKIIVYQFEGQPEITINPIAYIDNNLVFTVPAWDKDSYLMELSEGDLRQLLLETYDH